jgi:hypothetical protein
MPTRDDDDVKPPITARRARLARAPDEPAAAIRDRDDAAPVASGIIGGAEAVGPERARAGCP